MYTTSSSKLRHRPRQVFLSLPPARTPAYDQSAEGRRSMHNHTASINRRACRNPKFRHERTHDMTKCRTLPQLQSQEFRHIALVVKFNRPYGQPWTPLAWIWQSLLGKRVMQIGQRRDVYLETKYIHSNASALWLNICTNNTSQNIYPVTPQNPACREISAHHAKFCGFIVHYSFFYLHCRH